MSGVSDAAKRIVRRGLRRAGLTVQRYSPATVSDAQVQALLRHHRVDLVIDVGANAGQYAQSIRAAGYTERIISFEPLPGPWRECATRAERDPLWSMGPRAALGATNGTVEIHVAGNSVSSSLLPMNEAHQSAAPDSSYVGRECVQMLRLDQAAAEAVDAATRPFLKIDTQGYEGEVLKGAAGILDRVIGIQLEISLVPLYDGGSTFADLLQMMERAGFAPYALLPGFTDLQSGRMLQVDGIFFREPSQPHAGSQPHASA